METQSPQRESSAQTGSAAAPSTGSGQAPDPKSEAATGESAAQAFKEAGARLAEIKAYVLYYLQSQADRLKLAARETIFVVLLAPLALLMVGAIVVAAVVLLLVGLANGIGGVLGNRVWLGDVIVAVVVLTLIPLVAKMLISRLFGLSRKTTVEKYESRKVNQRARFGHDVEQRARESDR